MPRKGRFKLLKCLTILGRNYLYNDTSIFLWKQSKITNFIAIIVGLDTTAKYKLEMLIKSWLGHHGLCVQALVVVLDGVTSGEEKTESDVQKNSDGKEQKSDSADKETDKIVDQLEDLSVKDKDISSSENSPDQKASSKTDEGSGDQKEWPYYI